MFRNSKVSMEKQRELYGENGDKIIDVFESKFDGDNEEETITAMKNKILEKGGYLISKHCGTADDYSKYNVIDISVRHLMNLGVNVDEFVLVLETHPKITKTIDERKL